MGRFARDKVTIVMLIVIIIVILQILIRLNDLP